MDGHNVLATGQMVESSGGAVGWHAWRFIGSTCLRSGSLDLTGTGERAVNLTHVG